jgi:multiple RNA-binding domain-containing protein 1
MTSEISSSTNLQQSSSSSSSSSLLTKTRVCLRNIPPHWDETKLQQFLLQSSSSSSSLSSSLTSSASPCITITDCHILRQTSKQQQQKSSKSRQVAFVGLATPEQASHIVHYFHNTYCSGSSQKLIVEYARLKSKSKTVMTTNHPKQQQEQQPPPPPPKIENPTKQEFLKQYSSSKKPKFWANDDDDDDDGNNHHLHLLQPIQDKDPDKDPSDGLLDTPTTIMKTENSDKILVSDLEFLRSKASTAKDDLESDDDQDDDDDDQDENNHHNNNNITHKESTTNNNSMTRHQVENHQDPNRLFVRNLPFGTTLDELHQLFEPFGSLLDCHIPVDDQKRSKGFAFVTFDSHHSAKCALHDLNGTDWKGRFLDIHMARRPPPSSSSSSLQTTTTTTATTTTLSNTKLSWKEQHESIQHEQQTRTHKGWSANLVRGDAVVDSMAAKLGISAAKILNLQDGHAGDAAVKVALGETQILQENRNFFAQYGVDMEALVSSSTTSSTATTTIATANQDHWKRSQTWILVKNLPFPTEQEELSILFGKVPSRILISPSKTIALVQFEHPVDAKRAFKKLAYKRFKHVPLYLEWAPLISQQETVSDTNNNNNNNDDDDDDDIVHSTGNYNSIYIQNLHFDTTEDDIRNVFTKAQIPIRAVRIPRKVAPQKKTLAGKDTNMVSRSMGFGFVECASPDAVRTAITKLQGVVVQDHAWQLERSTAQVTAPATTPATPTTQTVRRLPTKLICRNVPFQATRKELLQLFGSLSFTLKKIRLPTKLHGNHHRGFAFVEFLTHADAVAAKQSLSRTHLYGRHLVLEWAQQDDDHDMGDHDNHVTALRNKAKRDVDKLGLNVMTTTGKKLKKLKTTTQE